MSDKSKDLNQQGELGDYEVGYKRPPQATRFKKGVSGNPSGRPRRPKTIESTLLKELSRKISINENGVRKRITKLEAASKQMVNKAVSGDSRAISLLFSLRESLAPHLEADQSKSVRQVNASADLEVIKAFLSRMNDSSDASDACGEVEGQP